MILSMTGFGQASGSVNGKEYAIDIKSLNGKTVDVRMKLPLYIKEKELTIRKTVISHAARGKFEVNIVITSEQGDGDYRIDERLFKKFYTDLRGIYQDLGESSIEGFAQAIFRIPEVVTSNSPDLDDQEWVEVHQILVIALQNLEGYRKDEGNAMLVDLKSRVKSIHTNLNAIEPHEKDRLTRLKDRISRNMGDNKAEELIDQNRFEQELIYYLERLDINEEKVRLTQHCHYFLDLLNDPKIKVKGKKLGFISQEMGREINTLGSKAQYAEIQKLVVNMKDELEKIKEQVLNVV